MGYNSVMAYIDKEKQKAFCRNWIRERRAQWLRENGPCRQCGSWTRLEVDHIDPKQKVSHNVWSWRKDKRDAELKKCQVLCYKCHKEKTANDKWRPITHGTHGGYGRGCRCEACRGFKLKYMAAYHSAHPRKKKLARIGGFGESECY